MSGHDQQQQHDVVVDDDLSPPPYMAEVAVAAAVMHPPVQHQQHHPHAVVVHHDHGGGGGGVHHDVVGVDEVVVYHSDESESNGNQNKWAKNGYGAPITRQTGKFSKVESEIVRSAIEEYCTAKQISVARLCSEHEHKSELKGAWMEIARHLPERSVQSVYRHGIRRCHPFKRGAWSEDECRSLVELVNAVGKKWAAIQNKLNRSADSCRDKWREMSEDYTKGRWKTEEEDELQKTVRQWLHSHTQGATEAITDLKELGQLVEEEKIQIPWSDISKRIGKRSRLSCFKKWQKLTGTGPSTQSSSASMEPDAKRLKTEAAVGAGAAAVMAAAVKDAAVAELAAETVEALELPDTETLAAAAVASKDQLDDVKLEDIV